MESPARSALPAVLWPLLFGNFVIGTGVMVVPGTLNEISNSLDVSVSTAGQLISAAALLMCIGAPLLAALVAGWDRRRLLAAPSREALFTESDVLSLHLRLNEETFGIVKLEDLNRMKPTSLIVNTSRAELVEPEALIAALNRGRPGMAAIDVFESEPILQGHALLRLENCICTPHIGYVEQESYELYFGAAFDNVVNYIRGTPTNIVNPGALQVRR